MFDMIRSEIQTGIRFVWLIFSLTTSSKLKHENIHKTLVYTVFLNVSLSMHSEAHLLNPTFFFSRVVVKLPKNILTNIACYIGYQVFGLKDC